MLSPDASDLSLDVLVVEDEADSRASLTDVLEMVGHRVSAVGCARDAIAHQRLEAIDVIIMDRQLPDGMAEDHVEKLSELAPNADIIVVTGYADLDGTIAAFRQGVSDYIIKPVDSDALLKRLSRLAELRHTEFELRTERQFATTVLQTAEAIILVLDRDGRIQRFNQYFADVVGYALEEVSGLDWFESFIPLPDRERTRNAFMETLHDHTSGVVNPILTRSGEVREVRWSNTTLKTAAGDIIGVLAVGLDISDLLETQKKLLQSERLAAIGQTMTGLAHESRNSLQRLQNGVELLRDDLFENQSAMRDLDKIERACNDLRDLLEEVRAYAAPIRLDLHKIAIKDVWRRAWRDVELRWSDRDATIVETDCPSTTMPLDERRFRQVFVNLFENALDACADPVEIRIGATDDDGGVTIFVEDNGPGISAEASAKVLDAFYTTKATGTGLGLAIVDRIVRAHGGELSVSNRPRGACFDIRLPRNVSNVTNST